MFSQEKGACPISLLTNFDTIKFFYSDNFIAGIRRKEKGVTGKGL